MPNLKIVIEGAYRWIDAAAIDAANSKTALDLQGVPATAHVTINSGQFARLVIHASADPDTRITADILRGEKSVCLKRYYNVGENGHLDRVITFDPDA